MGDQRYEVREIELYPNTDGTDGTFELSEGERILDANYRNRNALLIAVASPTTASRCMAVTTNDTRCEREAVDGSDYCGHPSHGEDDA